MEKIAYYVSMTIIAFAIFFMGVVTLLLLYPYKLVDVKEPLPVLNKNVKRGDTLSIVFDYTKNNNYKVHSVKTIICDDGNLVTLAPMDTNLPSGTNKFVSSSTVIPEKTSINTHCKVVFSSTYEPNPIRTMTKVTESEKFFISE